MFPSSSAALTVEAGICQPLDADSISHLAFGDSVVGNSDNDSNTFVTSNKRRLGLEGPISQGSMEIGVATAYEMRGISKRSPS